MEGGSIGPVKPARMVFSDDGNFSFKVLLKYSEVFILCPGIREYEKEFGECVRFQSKNLRVWTLPHQRHDSSQCLLWHKPSNVQLGADSPLFDLCTNCKMLYHDLQAIKKCALASSPFHKEKWTEVSSNHPLKYLSSANQGKKLAKKGKEVKRLQKALSKFDDTSFDVELREIRLKKFKNWSLQLTRKARMNYRPSTWKLKILMKALGTHYEKHGREKMLLSARNSSKIS